MIETKISYETNSSFELRRLKDFAKINKGKQLKDDEYFNGPYPYINGGINPSAYINIYNNQGPFIAISEGGASAGYSQIFEGNVWVGAHCYVLKTNQNLKYVYYVLKGFEKEIMNRKTGSAMPNLQKSKFNNTLFPIIYNSYRQENIVKYLDKINYILLKQIKKYNKKIELLKEYKEALIYETVTKGLDKNVEMKDSGINSIGKYPVEWELKRTKDLFKIGRGRVIATSDVNEKDINNKYPVYSAATVNEGVIGYLSTFDFSSELITWTTDGAKAGTVFLRKGTFNCTNVCGTLKLKKIYNIAFFKYALSIQTPYYKRADINGAKIMNNEMGRIKIVFPKDINIQNKIVDFLDKKTKEIDIEVGKLSKKIELIEELKESIIYECVTGKLDIEVEGENYQKIIESI